MQFQFLVVAGVAGLQVADVAFDARPLPRHAYFEEGLAERVGPAVVGDQPVRGAMARVHVRVDEARADEVRPGVDLGVDGAVERRAGVQDAVAFVDDLMVAIEGVAAVAPADDPAAAHARAHRGSHGATSSS